MRSRQGQSLVELAAGLLVVIPILLALLDCAFLVAGAAAADNLCRDAARAAASGPPEVMVAGERTVSNSGEPVKRVKTVMERIYKLGIPVKIRDSELKVVEKLEDPIPAADIGGSINGNVVVNSTVDVYPPFIIGVVTHQSIAMRSRHGFPFTYVVPAQSSISEP